VSRPEVHLRDYVITRRTSSAELLAGGARIHVDFHADRHFDDLRGFPGHFGSPCCSDEFRPPDKLPRQEKFASEIFHYKPPRVILLQRDSVVPTTFAFRIKQNADIKRLCRVASGGMQGTTNKELVKFVRLPIPLALPH
jgi:hypothetical protein